MKRFTSRSLMALGVVVALGLSTPAVAFASGLSTPAVAFAGSRFGSTSQKSFHQEMEAYNASRRAIQLTFRSAVSSARATYFSALTQTTSSARRSAARQAMETAIIQAAAARSVALTALGNPPKKFPSRASHNDASPFPTNRVKRLPGLISPQHSLD